MKIELPILTPHAQSVIQLAKETAIGMEHNYIGTEHLLMALCDTDGVAGRILAEYKVTPQVVRDELSHKNPAFKVTGRCGKCHAEKTIDVVICSHRYAAVSGAISLSVPCTQCGERINFVCDPNK